VFPKIFLKVWYEEKGEVIVEYGLILVIIALILIGILLAFNNSPTI
jgi:Flp pilus assembly pilin Flp